MGKYLRRAGQYEKAGDWEAAVRSYEKALELKPKQAHAADGVKRVKK